MLELCDIDAYYGHAQALRGVSLQVGPGEIVALLGANGAGKSTTLLTISGLLRPRKGHILFRGKPMSREKPGRIVGLGISHCPEGRALFPEMTVQDNLGLGAFLRRDREGIAEAVVDAGEDGAGEEARAGGEGEQHRPCEADAPIVRGVAEEPPVQVEMAASDHHQHDAQEEDDAEDVGHGRPMLTSLRRRFISLGADQAIARSTR